MHSNHLNMSFWLLLLLIIFMCCQIYIHLTRKFLVTRGWRNWARILALRNQQFSAHCWFWYLPPFCLHWLQWLFSFCVFFNRRTLLNDLSLFFSSDIFCWPCVIVWMTQSWPLASPQAQAGSTINLCAVVPALDSQTWAKTSFLLPPFASPSLLSKCLHYRDTVTFQGLQWAGLCSSFFFADPSGTLGEAESPRMILGVQISNKLLHLGSPASLSPFFFFLIFFLQAK